MLFILSIPVNAQDYYAQLTTELNISQSISKIIDQSKPESGETLNENDLEKVFYKTHRKVLKQYKTYSKLSETLEEGVYDCVTGTAVYSYIYESLGAKVEILETPSHVFLLIENNGNKYIVESTSPLDGFYKIDKDFKINNHDSFGLLVADESSEVINNVINKISLKELAAILLHNQAAKNYLNQDFDPAISLINEALSLYPSARSVHLKNLILKHIN
ncbi:hypothetical protein [Marinigracilibium pacificum]|uniref:Uncharacterized protein n=1 Tax=Marinigracilibium pacificum TaxID=2729599 RepID=A0A848ITN7_9BACT|nr:hypothetical protein [Marinigracilibium pacificum]NMM47116.1 hypothetical protein [Marinigracilibium pacificum]